MKKVLFLLILFFIFSSCSNPNKVIEKKLIGTWTIDEVIYDDQNILLYLLVNMIDFKKDNRCSLPIVMEQSKEEKKGTWSLNGKDNTYHLTIESNNQIFEGTYLLRFENDYESKLLKMHLTSGNVYLKCSKLLHNFEKGL